MDLAPFLNSISSPALKVVVAHWQEAGANPIPSWNDIRPAAIAAQLPIIWAYKYDRSTGEFTGRLAGNRISQIFGKNFRGLKLSEAQPPEAFPGIYAQCKRIVTEPAACHTAGKVFQQLNRFGHGERIMLPLATDGVCDGILGCTEYHSQKFDPGVTVFFVNEGIEWFSLAA